MAIEKGFGGSKEFSRNQKGSNARKIAVAGMSGAALFAVQAIAAMAAGAPAAIKSITIDNNQQIVIHFANAGFPAVPHLLDVPGPSHRVVFDFVNAALDRGTLPAPEIFSNRITKALPVIKGVRYLNLTSTPKPTARIVIDLPEKLEVKPKVVKLEEDLVVLSLGEGVDLSEKDKEQGEAGPSSQGLQPQAEPVAQAGEGSAATAAPAVEAPVPGHKVEMEAAESAAASAPTAAPSAGGTAAAGQTAEAENVGTWDWTNGQPAAKTAQAEEKDSSTPAIPVVATNTQMPAALAETQDAAEASAVQSELQKEAGAAPANNAQPVELKPEENQVQAELQKEAGGAQAAAPEVQLKPAMPEPQQEAPAQAAAPAAQAPQAEEAAAASTPDVSADAAAETAAPPARRAPQQRQVSAPAQKDDVIEQEVRTETPDQAPEQEIDAPAAPANRLSLPQDAPAGKTAAQSKADAKSAYNKAVQAHLNGKLGEAISNYLVALQLNPEFSQAHCNLGLIYNQEHNYAKALSEFRKALAINPKDAITYNGIGAALRAEKDMVGAIKNWQTAVSLDPKLATAHYNLGTAYELQKDNDRAMESYRQAVKNDYRLGEAYYRMGLIMQKKNLNDEATEQYSRALKVANNAEFSEDARQRLAALSNKKR